VNRGNVILRAAHDRPTAERLAQHVVDSCCFCDWTLEGTLAQTRQAHLEHRQAQHPDAQPRLRKSRKNRKGQINLGKSIDENIAAAREQGGAGWHRG